ncbi:hypothetical protein AB0M36_06935 [Actinoplanes sp. NPDC051346]|uniref:hypothetical protein n=1 Tax=Actinoplanes sp. NPDC051346 TaxID=3155048 RepID=UPI00343B7610
MKKRGSAEDTGQDGRIMALARARRPDDPEVDAAWQLIIRGLTHQGLPSHHLNAMISILDGTSNVAGWDEFGIEEHPTDPDRVVIWFVQEEACCARAALLAELLALRG